MMLPENRRQAVYLAAGVVLPAALLIGSVILSPAKLVYDEGYHLQLADEIRSKGWIEGLLSDEHGSAAGPLYSAIHLAVRPFTGLQPPAIRWVNLVCLAATIAGLAWWLRAATNSNPWWACQILAVPFLWPGSGMALTELPALLAFTLFGAWASLALKAARAQDAPGWIYAVAAGLALGVAILGRQTYLVAVPAILCTAIFARQYVGRLLTMSLFAIIASGWLFWLWGGLVPAHQSHTGAGLRPENALLGMTYLGVAAAFISPASLLPRSRRQLVGVLLVSLGVTAALYAYFTYVLHTPLKPPAASLLTKIVGKQFAGYVGFVPRWLMTAAGILWLWVTLEDGWRRRHEPDRVLLVLSLLALAAAPAKVSHLFSSRYVLGALTFMVVQFAPPSPPQAAAAIRSVAGAAIGAAILWSYYLHTK